MTLLQGFEMAKNLQAKLPPSDTIRLFDINKKAMEELSVEMKSSLAGGASVETADTVADAAKDAVRASSCQFTRFLPI